ncbi:MAG: membrane associated rhomboid family serine protease [Parvibaculaceae bacterium]|jgi:membrane associated rhomboid family serine protease
MSEFDPTQGVRKEPPAFNVPSVILGLLSAMWLVYALVSFEDMQTQINVMAQYGFMPARYTGTEGVVYGNFPGGLLSDILGFVSYAFLHGSLTHILLNSVWLVVFGTPVARRIGVVRFLSFYLVCAALAAIFHMMLHVGSTGVVIGASGAVSGLMGGAARFIFLTPGPLGALQGGTPNGQAPRAQATLFQSLSDRRTLIFVGLWVGLNFLFGVSGLSPNGATVSIAWEAHLGGFLAGLLLFGFFDPLQRSASGGPGNVDYGEWRDKK